MTWLFLLIVLVQALARGAPTHVQERRTTTVPAKVTRMQVCECETASVALHEYKRDCRGDWQDIMCEDSKTFIIMVAIELDPEYGYVILSAILSFVVVMWKAFKVGQARKKYQVFYPTMYEDKKNSVFNCYQRAHQNTLENYPAFLTLLLLSGLHAPLYSAIAGLGWCVARVVYAIGYYSGDPKKRMYGSFYFFFILYLLYGTFSLGASDLLGWY